MSANEQHIYGADGEGSGSEGSEDTEDAPEFEATPRRTPTAAVSTLKEATTGVVRTQQACALSCQPTNSQVCLSFVLRSGSVCCLLCPAVAGGTGEANNEAGANG
jgi:hypothetical protein